jgi:hypothetical protein
MGIAYGRVSVCRAADMGSSPLPGPAKYRRY